MHIRKISLVCLTAAICLAPLWRSPIVLAQALPTSVVAIIDYTRVLEESTAYADLDRQINGLYQRFRTEIELQEISLKEESDRVNQTMLTVGDEAKVQLQTEFQQKLAAFQQDAARKEQELKDAIEVARNKINDALRPVMAELAMRRGVTYFLEKRSVFYGGDAVDLTSQAIEILNVSFPTVTLDLQNAGIVR